MLVKEASMYQRVGPFQCVQLGYFGIHSDGIAVLYYLSSQMSRVELTTLMGTDDVSGDVMVASPYYA